MHAEGVDDDERDADERLEEHVDGRRDQPLDVGPHLLQLAQRLAAALVLEQLVRQPERVADAVRVEPRPEPLGDDVHVVVLEVLGHARDEGDAHGGEQQQADAAQELARRVAVEARRVLVDHVPEDERVEQGEDLVDRRQHERQQDEPPVRPQVRQQQSHGLRIRIAAARRRRKRGGEGPPLANCEHSGRASPRPRVLLVTSSRAPGRAVGGVDDAEPQAEELARGAARDAPGCGQPDTPHDRGRYGPAAPRLRGEHPPPARPRPRGDRRRSALLAGCRARTLGRRPRPARRRRAARRPGVRRRPRDAPSRRHAPRPRRSHAGRRRPRTCAPCSTPCAAP